MQCNAMQCNAMQCNAPLRYATLRYALFFCALTCSVTFSCIRLSYLIWHGLISYDIMRHASIMFHRCSLGTRCDHLAHSSRSGRLSKAPPSSAGAEPARLLKNISNELIVLSVTHVIWHYAIHQDACASFWWHDWKTGTEWFQHFQIQRSMPSIMAIIQYSCTNLLASLPGRPAGSQSKRERIHVRSFSTFQSGQGARILELWTFEGHL